MKKTYHDMMQQQKLSSQAADDFYEKLDQTAPRKSMGIYKKVLIAVACICVLIPTAVFAAGNIFDFATLRLTDAKDHKGRDAIGYTIDFNTDKGIPLAEFNEKWHNSQEIYHEEYYLSWEDAQEDLGIDFLENPLLESETFAPRLNFFRSQTYRKDAYSSVTVFRTTEGQLYSVSNTASFKETSPDKPTVHFYINTSMLVDEAEVDQQMRDVHTSLQYILQEKDLDRYTTEQYTTQNGIPVMLVTHSHNTSDYENTIAVFRVNGVRYTIDFGRWDMDYPMTQKEYVIRILEGFVLE